RPRPHALVHIVQDAAKDGRVDALPEQIEGLDERHARLEQGGQFLIENQKLPGRHPGRARCSDRKTPDQPFALNRKDIQPSVLEVSPEARLVVCHVHAFDNLAGGGRQAAPEFHGSGASMEDGRTTDRRIMTATTCLRGHYSFLDYTKVAKNRLRLSPHPD